jgi:hypothetical protein
MNEGHLIEMVLPQGGVCRCGRRVEAMETVQYWQSSYGQAHDQVVACNYCERPKGLIPERMWLMKQRHALKNMAFPHIYGNPGHPMPPEILGSMQQLDSELDGNWRQINVIMMKLLEKLPTCEECPKYGTYGATGGVTYCDTHAGEHPTAQALPWAKELQELGVTKDV